MSIITCNLFSHWNVACWHILMISFLPSSIYRDVFSSKGTFSLIFTTGWLHNVMKSAQMHSAGFSSNCILWRWHRDLIYVVLNYSAETQLCGLLSEKIIQRFLVVFVTLNCLLIDIFRIFSYCLEINLKAWKHGFRSLRLFKLYILTVYLAVFFFLPTHHKTPL